MGKSNFSMAWDIKVCMCIMLKTWQVWEKLFLLDFRESPPKTTNANRGKLGSRVSHTVTSQDATSTKIGTPPPSSIISPVPRQQGNKIPKVQTETADTTRDDLVDVRTELEEIETNEALKYEYTFLTCFL